MKCERWTDEHLNKLAYHGDDRYRRLKEENRKLRSNLSETRRELQADLRNLRQELRQEIRRRTS
jgi:cell division protein ZapA (FtsZ GTPase activity inhibitor)